MTNCVDFRMDAGFGGGGGRSDGFGGTAVSGRRNLLKKNLRAL